MARRTGWIFLATGAALLAGLFVLFRPAPPPVPPPAPAAAAAVPARPSPRTYELVVKDGRLAAGPATIQVRQGDVVLLRITSDRADELHLHGYDLSVLLTPGAPAELLFTADRSGRFDYELHHGHAGIGALEVQPR